MTGARAERFVVLNLRLLAASFAIVGILFIATPDGVLDVISDLGNSLPLGQFTRAPETTEPFWLALGFAYMVVITGICLVVQTDVVRYRPMLLVLAAGKTASSLGAAELATDAGRAPGLRAGELRILRAFAEAMAPGFGALPPAASPGGLAHAQRSDAVEVAEPLNRYLASMPRRSVGQVKL